MASITIRNLEDPLKARLRVRAAQHGCSMEQEVRHILKTVLTVEQQPIRDLGQLIQLRFAALGGIDLPTITRDSLREPPNFKE